MPWSIIDMQQNITPVTMKTGALMERSGSATAVVSGGVGVTGWLAENYEWLSALGVIIGIVVGVTGLVINTYYLHKRDKRDRRDRGL